MENVRKKSNPWPVIDFHSHVLPGIDDGSENVKESLILINRLRKQGVDIVCATPHFYASDQSPAHFLDKRQRCIDALYDSLPPDSPEIRIGAEVCYYSGISRSRSLPLLCLQGTNLLLLEMPFTRWDSSIVHEVSDLARSGDFTILLAHVERYRLHRSLSLWDMLIESGVYMQSNADYFLRLRTKRKALRLLEEKRIHVIGSDCHNASSRPPRMAEARSHISFFLGSSALSRLDRSGFALISNNS